MHHSSDSEMPRTTEASERIPKHPDHWKREHFIPIRQSDLIDALVGRLEHRVEDQDRFLAFCEILTASIHYEFHEHLLELKDCYAPFNPDADTRRLDEPDQHQREERASDLFERCVKVLRLGNFQRLSRFDIEKAVGTASDWGVRLDVDFDVFERLEVFARGDIVGRRVRRRLRNWYRLEEVDVPIYQRLVVIFQLRDHKRLDKDIDVDSIFVKLFKNIPKRDLEMMLPGTKVRMSIVDRTKIVIPTVSGVGITVFKSATLIKAAFALTVVGMSNILAFIGLLAALTGYGAKSFFGYLRTRDKYHLNLTRSLYFQNLDNNAGVLSRLVDEAEVQEFREAILGYFVLWQSDDQNGWTHARLDGEVEKLLKNLIDVNVDFEVHDALRKLRHWNLVEKVDDQRWKAVPIQQALARVDEAWDALFQFRHACAKLSTMSR